MTLNEMQTDLLVIGAGPAGLATAIAARRAGFSVILADHAVPPIDKACGEGIMPDGLAALARLGVEIPREKSFPFRGIRFLSGDAEVDASFPRESGFGVRRTALHEMLTAEAAGVGVRMRWGARVSEVADGHAILNDRRLRCRWIVGADGQNSMVRHRVGIGRVRSEMRRFGFRQHFAVRPWTDVVEVYWSDRGQAYVTPVAENEVCVALITRDPHLRLSELETVFPALAEKLGDAVTTSRAQGSITSTRRLDSVVSGNVALVGEASGSVDAITGVGMSLGFQQAVALVAAMQEGDLQAYQRAHTRIGSTARAMAMLMLGIGDRPWLRGRVLRALATRPEIFAQMLSVHVGESKISSFGLDRALSLGWQILRA